MTGASTTAIGVANAASWTANGISTLATAAGTAAGPTPIFTVG